MEKIIKDIHETRERLAAEHNFDIDAICDMISEREKQHPERIVNLAEIKRKERKPVPGDQ